MDVTSLGYFSFACRGDLSMDLLQRYAIPGYLFAATVVILSDPLLDAISKNTSNKYWELILGAIAGLPLGYLLGQISTFLYHLIPAFSVANKIYNVNWSPLFISSSVGKEARLYCEMLDKLKSEFDLRGWLSLRWSYLIVSFNILAAIVFAPIAAAVINQVQVSDPFKIPKFVADHAVPIAFVYLILFLIIIQNLYKLYFFLVIVYRKSIGMKSFLQSDRDERLMVAFPALQKRSFSASVMTHNRPEHLKRMLQSVTRQSGAAAEILVLDSSSEQYLHQNSDVVASIGTRHRILHILAPHKLSAKRNLAAKLSTQEILFLFDDDVILDSDYFSQMMDVYQKYPRAIGAMGLVRNQRQFGLLERLYRTMFQLYRLSEAGVSRVQRSGYLVCPVESQDACQHRTRERIEPVVALWGCNMSFRRALFDYEKFDESWDVFTDVEFSRVATRYGALLLNRDAGLLHLRATSGRMGPRALLIAQTRAARRLIAQRMEPSVLNGLAYYWSLTGVMGLLLLTFLIDPTSSSYEDPKPT